MTVIEVPPTGAVHKSPAVIRALRVVACYVTIASCLPYLTLKALWLLGRSTGAANAAGVVELLDPRHIVGDLATAGMELVAIALVLAFTYSWGRRLPAVLVLLPIWVGTGLLAPITLGFPLGLLAQAFVGGSPIPTGNELHHWVYAIADGGFVVQGVGLLAAFLGYAHDRWREMFRVRMTQLRATGRVQRAAAAAAAVIAIGYAAMLVAWSVIGTKWGGPAGFETVAQKVFLLATGPVVMACVVAVLALLWRRGNGRALTALTVAWVGTGVTVMSGPTQVALSNHGNASLSLMVISLAATLAGLVLTGSVVRILTLDAESGTDRRSAATR